MEEKFKILCKAILAGIMISIGGTIYLSLENKMVGAFLFSIGLFMICVNGYNLYTGKIGYVIERKKGFIIELLITLVGNFIGTVTCGLVLSKARIYSSIKEVAVKICTTKLNDDLLSIFILSIFCGMLMYLAVDLYKKKTDCGRYLGIFLGVTVFILAGFEHCVANMYYFTVADMWEGKTLLYTLIMILGNTVGSIIISKGHNLIVDKR